MRLKGEHLVACLFFGAFAAWGVCATFDSKFMGPMSVLLTAKTTMATLNNDYTERRSRSTVAYNVTYQFTIDGTSYSGSSATSEAPSAQMEVQYLPANPGVNGLELRGHAGIDLAIFSVMAGVLLVCGAGLVLHLMHRDDGRPAFEAGLNQPGDRRRD